MHSFTMNKEPYSIVDTFAEKSAHSIDKKKTIGFMRTDTAVEVFLFAYDILETQFPKLSKNTVECHSKKRERETKLM